MMKNMAITTHRILNLCMIVSMVIKTTTTTISPEKATGRS